MVKRTFVVDCEKYGGQELPGWETEHLTVALDGTPIRQAHQRGGVQTIQMGQFLITFDGGQQVVLSVKSWKAGEGEEEPEPVYVAAEPIPEPELTKKWVHGQPVRLAANWPPKVPFDNEIKTEGWDRFRWDRVQGEWIKLPPQLPEANAARLHPMTKRAQTYQPSSGWTYDEPLEDD